MCVIESTPHNRLDPVEKLNECIINNINDTEIVNNTGAKIQQ